MDNPFLREKQQKEGECRKEEDQWPGSVESKTGQ